MKTYRYPSDILWVYEDGFKYVTAETAYHALATRPHAGITMDNVQIKTPDGYKYVCKVPADLGGVK